ncbi:hypothetical protein sync_1063 [Synechococcus sp. CC9311]|nr:hypothetical protein sync_1063 [Synechococcus sp. CC9311]
MVPQGLEVLLLVKFSASDCYLGLRGCISCRERFDV